MDSFPQFTADIPLHLFAKFMRAFVSTGSPPFNIFRQTSVNYISLYVDSWDHCMSVDLRPLVIARSIDFHVELPDPLQVLCRPSAHWDHMSRKGHLRDITFSVSLDFGPIITFTISNEIGELWTKYGYEAVEIRYPRMLYLATDYAMFKCEAWGIEVRIIPEEHRTNDILFHKKLSFGAVMRSNIS